MCMNVLPSYMHKFMYVCVLYAWLMPEKVRRQQGIPWNWITELSYGYWKLFAAKPSLQPMEYYHYVTKQIDEQWLDKPVKSTVT